MDINEMFDRTREFMAKQSAEIIALRAKLAEAERERKLWHVAWEAKAKEAGVAESKLAEAQKEAGVAWDKCEERRLEGHAFFERAVAAEARAAALAAEVERLREALRSVLDACDQGRMVERGAGGMTTDAQIRRSVINGVPAWPIEKARADLIDLRCKGDE